MLPLMASEVFIALPLLLGGFSLLSRIFTLAFLDHPISRLVILQFDLHLLILLALDLLN